MSTLGVIVAHVSAHSYPSSGEDARHKKLK